MNQADSSLINTAEATPKPSRRRFWLIMAAVTVIFISGTGVVGIAWYLKRKAPRDAYALARAGTEAASRNDHVRAVALFAEAIAQDPSQTNYLMGAAQSAFLAGRKPEAKMYAQRAWDAGRHTTQMLRMLLADTGTQDRRKSLAEAERLLASITDETERLTLHAEVLSEMGREEDADAAWRQLLARRPDPVLITRFGHWLVSKERVDAARTLLQQARSSNHLDSEGYFDLLNILHMDLLVAKEPVPGKPDQVRQADLLAVIAEARSRQLIDDRLQFFEALLTYGRLDLAKATQLLTELRVPVKDVAANRWRQRARLLLATILMEMGRPQEVAELVRIPRDAGPDREGEDLLYASLSAPDRKLTERLQDFARVQKLLSDQPILNLLEARLHAANSDRKNALASYGKLHRLLATCAGPLLEQADLLIAENRSQEAMGQVQMVHRLYGTTRWSLMLMSKIVGPGADVATGQAMQQILVSASQTDALLLGPAADFALGRGDYQTAEQIFTRIAQQDTKGAQPVIGLIRIALAKQDWASALSQCDQLPASPNRDVLRALALRGQGKLGESLEMFESAAKEPHALGLDIEAGFTALRAGDLERAKLARNRALAAAPEHVEVLELVSATALALGEPAEALTAAKRALAVGVTAARERLRCEALVAIPRESEALESLDAACRKFNDDAGLALLRARLLLKLGRPQEARTALLDIDRVQPGSLVVRRFLAECALALNDLPNARLLVDELIGKAPQVVDHQLLRIRVIAQGGNLEVARSAIEALPASVKEEQRLLLHAWLDNMGGKPAAAISRLSGHLDEPAIALAWANFVLNSDAAGATDVAPVLAKLPIADPELLRLASVAEQKSRWRDAAALCGRVLANNPEDPILNNNWGWYAMQLPGADPAPIIAALEKAARLLPGNPGIVDSYTEALLWAGRPMVARNVLQAQGDLIARNPQLQHNLGRALEGNGDTKGAQAAFRRSLALATAAESWPLRESKEALAARLTGGLTK